jgi:hypothetical protein
MENVGIFYGNLVYFMAIWNISQQFSIFYGPVVYFLKVLVYFSRFGML